MNPTILILLAGLMGAAGVGLAAAAAHGPYAGSGLESAAHMLLFHAIAVLAGASALDRLELWRPALTIALYGWVLGASLFAGSIALRTFTGVAPFPMAAPTGGSILILSWLALAAATIFALRR